LPVPSSNAIERELKVKLTWVVVFRTVAISLLLIVSVVRLLSSPQTTELSPVDSFSFALIGGVYLLTLIYGVLLRQGLGVSLQGARAQVVGDVILSSSLVYLTGAADSPFVFTYSLAVVAAAILLFRRGAFVTATATSIAFTVMSLAVHWGHLRPPTGSVPLLPERLAFVLTSNALAQFLIAALAGYLAEQASRAGGRLSAREADLKELVALQNRIVDAMPSGLLTCDGEGEITFINPAGVSILGQSSAKNVPRHMNQALPGAMRLPRSTRRAELSIDTPRGPRILGLAVTPLEERGTALLVVFQDLTYLRRMQEELTRIDHLASLGRVSAQLAHEIRNPLASMRGSAQLLGDDVKNSPHSLRLAQIIMRECDRLAALVESYLELARPPPPAKERIRIDLVVAETVEMLRMDPMSHGVLIEESLTPVNGLADAAQLRQVLINLLRNALVAAGRGGAVRVSVDQQPSEARIRVWDSAGSIPPEELTRIFEPFYTTREAGTGLGLSTVHAIVQAHAGLIGVTSSALEGTTFTVALPGFSAAEG
jgi:two-component system sensor histidine kinase PilS (NtrC family)